MTNKIQYLNTDGEYFEVEAMADGARARTEVVWLNDATSRALSRGVQLALI
jgi:hypothetical protein